MIRVKMDYQDTLRQLQGIARDQLPFAFASSLTKAAASAQKQIQNRTKKVFGLHSDFIPKGIRIESAKKAEIQRYGFTTAAVLTAPIISGWMPRHETGEAKTPRSKNLSIPSPSLLAQGARTSRGAIKSGKKPKALLQRMDQARQNPRAKGKGRLPTPPFLIRGRGGNSRIVVRFGKERGDLRTLYTFAPRAKITPRWMFEQTVRRVAELGFPGIFARQLNHAIETAK